MDLFNAASAHTARLFAAHREARTAADRAEALAALMAHRALLGRLRDAEDAAFAADFRRRYTRSDGHFDHAAYAATNGLGG